MNDFERRVRDLITKFKAVLTKRPAGSGDLRRQASAQAQRAATAVKDMRDSDAAKRAATAVKDLRDSDTAKRAATALADLRQREPVRKAEESAKRALHDLRSGHNGDSKS
jgi:acyl-CoA synthetase (NDP forming)